MAKKQYLALMDVVSSGEWLILKGEVQRIQISDEGRPQFVLDAVEQTTIPKGLVVKHGSTFEAELDKHRLRTWTKLGAVADASETRHFAEMDTVFSKPVTVLGKSMSLADAFEAHMLYSLEDVVENAEGSMPFSEAAGAGKPVPIRAHDVLALFTEPDEAKELIEAAKAAINQPIGGK
jgi:hypothetical protein